MRDKAAEIFVERRYRTSHHNNILGTRNAEKNFLLGTPKRPTKRERGRRKDMRDLVHIEPAATSDPDAR